MLGPTKSEFASKPGLSEPLPFQRRTKDANPTAVESFRRRFLPSSVTIAIVALTIAIKMALFHTMLFESPILLLFSAIAFAAWYGGFTQGMLALVLALVFVLYYALVLSTANLPVDVWLMRIALLVIDGFVISLVCAKLRSASQTAKNAAHEAAVNDNRFKSIFASDMIGIIFFEFDGRILDANDYALNMLGIGRAELKSGALTWQMFTPEDHIQVSLDALEALKLSGTAKPFEKDYLRRDGSRRSCSVSATVVGNNQIVSFVLDITDSKRVQIARLSESQIFLDSVIENIPNMIFVKEAKDLRFVRFNKAGEKLLGYSRDQLLGRNDHDLFPKEQAETFTKADRQVLRRGAVVDIAEEPIQTSQGDKLLHTKKIPIMDSSGTAQYLLGISEDITERRHTEDQRIELLQSELARTEAEKAASRLRFLTEASTALNRSLDIQVMLNAFAKVLVGEMAGTCMIDLLDDEGPGFERLAVSRETESHPLDFIKCDINAAATAGPSVTLLTGRVQMFSQLSDQQLQDALRPCPDCLKTFRTPGPRSILIVPILYHTKVLGSITLVAIDSQRVYDELDLSVTQDLAKRAALAIENALLYSRAAEASRTKSAFLANISHEIRTPLGAMIGFAELSLEEQNLSAGNQEYIQKILKNGQQLLRIVNDVLDISKVESDRLQIERVKFSLPRLLDDVLSLLQTQAENKGISLALSKDQNIPQMVVSDPLRLRQILINMIGNAIKFTETGAVHVTARFQTSGGENAQSGNLSFLIEDTGVGITHEQARRLFEPFVQADESMTRKFGGTGLGLYISRKLARLLGGTVELQTSEPGQGSVFHVSVVVQLAGVARSEGEYLETSRAIPQALKGRVLVVEDSIDNQTLIQAFLQNQKLEIDLASNGKEGLQKTKIAPYDLILMDIQMPVMDGFEAIQALRSEGYTGQVVALTAHGMKGDRERCLEQGFDDYLCKPISRHSLLECVGKHLTESPRS